jgi:hypothetical protein
MAKTALCIGINDYPGTQSDLSGCVNDASDWAAALQARGFAVTSVVDAKATKAKMVAAMKTLIGEAVAGDSLVVTYSGHGTFEPDTSGDEPDGRDEGLCPYDIHRGRVLLDDEISQIFSARKEGVRVVMISDSCHSGSVIRWAPPDPDSDAPRPRFLPPAAWLPADKLPKGASGEVPTRAGGTRRAAGWLGALSLPGGDLLLAGCQDDEYSYDARFAGRPCGAFSHYALKTLEGLPPRATYADWYRAIRGYLPSASYPQTPQIFGDRRARQLRVLG